MKTLPVSLVLTFPFSTFADPAALTPRWPIPELLTTDKTRYTQVEIKKLYPERVSFTHSDGVATVALSEFDDTNMDRLIPGYTARRKAEAEALARREEEEARKTAEARQLAAAGFEMVAGPLEQAGESRTASFRAEDAGPRERELRRLRQELEYVSRQREILKRALGSLSAEMPPHASR